MTDKARSQPAIGRGMGLLRGPGAPIARAPREGKVDRGLLAPLQFPVSAGYPRGFGYASVQGGIPKLLQQQPDRHMGISPWDCDGA